MDDAMLETWIQAVNETGAEYGVTLLVSGSLITGHLTPTVRYRDWLREVGRRASITKTRQRLPSSQIGPITEQQADRARAEWDAAKHSADLDRPPGVTRFCVRDAAVGRLSGPEGWTHFPFLVLALDSVDGFSPVRLNA
jgi:hypothetical protein